MIAVFVAWRVSHDWRRQEIGKRRQAVAEQALTTVYQVAQALEDVRAPMIWAGEMVKDGDLLTGSEGSHYAIRNRLLAQKETIAALNKAILMTEVHFGKSAAQQIREFHTFLNTVAIANHMLSGTNADRYDPDFTQKLLRERKSYPPKDELGAKIKAATDRVRATLPHMRMPGEVDPDAPSASRVVALKRFVGIGREIP